ncbi:ricin-type beta-trefoil lectin domain protein [Kitasatospora purpeofusca]|uniref:ricin-type beta-trefoil lectin domain protein n=1 Tax=Kitasatospora purpeofusca TaxID=67352 RepID=UPI002A5AF090|nr:ricin-type beta-trefoil lectin domain protein [Kitasatospora purpeofusca]MDY0811275.1 ricin-type beta-trefoil lectin domain protein [Kitasatospora purpeofusca]
MLAAPGAAFADPGATPTDAPTGALVGAPTGAPTGAPASAPTAQEAAPAAEQAPAPAPAADGPAPSTPSKLYVKPQPVDQGGDGCGAGAPGWIGRTVPLGDGTSDVSLFAWSGTAQPGVGTVTVGFRVWDATAGESGDSGGVTRTSQSVVGTGGWGQATVGRALADGHQYDWNAWTTGGGVNSPVTADCAFKVDLTSPTPASIAPSTAFPPSGSGTTPTGRAGDPGITVRVTSKDPVPGGCVDGCLASGVREFRYTLDVGWPGVTGVVPASFAADGTAYADVPISVGADDWGSRQLSVSAVDGAGNADPRTSDYHFYAPWRDRPDVAGDVDVDGVPDFVAPAADGSLALFRGGSGAASQPETVSPAASSPLHDDWNNYLLAHRGAVVGQGDSLFAYHKETKQLFVYANDGNATPNPVFGRFTRSVSPLGGVSFCRSNGIDGTWNHITRMTAVRWGTGGTSLVTVEQGHLRYYYGTRSGQNNCLSAGVELGAPGEDWSGVTLMYPGDVNGVPTLWVRDTVTGAVTGLPLPLDAKGQAVSGFAPLPLPAHKPLLSALQGDGGAGLCADIDHGWTGNGTAAVLGTCSEQGAASSQAFTFGTDGSVHVLGKCLDVTDALTESGSPVNLWDCNNSPAQKWVAGPHLGTLVNPNSGRCLDAPGTAGPGAHLVIADCHDGASDRWTVPATRAVLPLGLAAGVAPLVDSPGDFDAAGHADLVVGFADGRKVRYPGIAPEGDLPRFGEPRPLSAQPAGYNIGSIHSQGRCLDNYGASNNSALRLYDCWNGASQDFWFASDGTLRTGGRCVGVEDNRTDWGAPVVMTDCQAAGGQIWTYREDGSIYNPASDSCLELPGWNDANGTALGIWQCYGNANQRWTLSPSTA